MAEDGYDRNQLAEMSCLNLWSAQRSSCSFIWKNLIGSQCQCQWWWWWCVCFEVLLWFNDRVSCRRNNTVRYRLVHVYVFASKVALKMVAERHKIWNRLAGKILHFLAHSANPVFRDKKCRILAFHDKRLCDIHHPDFHHPRHSPPPTFTTPM